MLKKYIIAGILFLVLSSIYLLYKRGANLKETLDVAIQNEKAFNHELDSLEKEKRVYQITIAQLNNSKDSILASMNVLRKELNVKDKNLKSLQYIQSNINRTDTIIFKDTIFNNNIIHLDTIIKDNWYQMKLKLRYPNIIVIEPNFTSEKYITISKKRETVNPPKKYWIQRLFQKKHTVLAVNVIEENPYIEVKEQKFIEIIK
jgi:hypothetical protein